MIPDQVLADGQIVVKNVFADLSMLDSAIVHHHDSMYADPAQQTRVDWVVAHATGNRVIEIGTATGHIINRVEAPYKSGVDINISRLLLAKMRYPHINFYYGSVFNLTPFYYAQYDCLIATEILEHIKYDTVKYALHHCLMTAPKVIITLPVGDDVLTNEEHMWEPSHKLLLEALAICGVPTNIVAHEKLDNFLFYVIERDGNA